MTSGSFSIPTSPGYFAAMPSPACIPEPASPPDAVPLPALPAPEPPALEPPAPEPPALDPPAFEPPAAAPAVPPSWLLEELSPESHPELKPTTPRTNMQTPSRPILNLQAMVRGSADRITGRERCAASPFAASALKAP